MKRFYSLPFALGSCLLLMPFLPMSPAALGNETQPPKVTKQKKSAKKNAEKTESSGESGSYLSAPTLAPKAAAVPLVKPAQATSLDIGNASQKNLNTDAEDTLLKGGAASKINANQKVQPALRLQEELAKSPNALSFGVFRSEHLANGQVAAPGVADFAAYFRSTTSKAPVPGEEKSPTSLKGALGTASKAELNRQQQAEQLRTQTVDSIRQILATKPNADTRFDLMMRISEIQVERHAYYLESEIAEFNEAHDAWKANPKGSAPIFKSDKSNAQLLQGIDALRSIVNQFPNHARLPEALFNLGFLMTQMNNDSAALYFERLVTRYPKSEFVPDAYLALGEFHFSKLNFEKAQANYQKVLGFKGSRAYNYGVYKLGWTYYNIRGKNDQENKQTLLKSLAAFRLLVKLSDGQPQDKILKDLRRDTLRDMVLVFADLGDIDTAQKYYESLGEPELYFTLLERLAWQNSENGEFATATQIYARLIAENPTNKKLPGIYVKLHDLYEKQQNRKELISSLGIMASSLSPDGVWMKAMGKDAERVAERNRLLASELKGWAEKFHAEAQKNRKESSYDDALNAYNLYLQNFGEQPKSYAAHFFRAEILAHREKFVEAADGYLRAASMDEKNSLKGKYTQDALLNAITAVDIVLSKSPAPKLPEAGKVPQVIPLTALHERLVRAIDMYVSLFPNNEKILSLSHRAASIVYAFGDYPSSNARWSSLAKRFPRSKEVSDGVKLSLKVFVEQAEWEVAAKESRKFLSIGGVKETALGQDLLMVLKSSIFYQAMALEKRDRRAEASDLFLAYHKEFQSDADAPKALFNAANNRFKLGKIDDAIGTLRIILAQYPNSELVSNALYLIASSYDAIGLFAESAASYEQLAGDPQAKSVAAEALMRATFQRLATGEFEKAAQDAQSFVETYPKHADVADAWQNYGKSQVKMGKAQKAAMIYTQGAESLAKNQPASGVLLYGLAASTYRAAGDEVNAQKATSTGISLFQSLPAASKTSDAMVGLRYLGLTQVALLDNQTQKIYKMTVTDGSQLTAQFTKIRDEAQKVAARYVGVAKLGNAEAGIGALYRIAEIQEFLGASLLRAPAPAGSKPEEIEKFRSTLEGIALPLQEEAAQLYLTAWARANETEAMTPFTKKLQEKLVALRPNEFKKMVEDMPVPVYFTSDFVVTDETRSLVSK